MEGFACGERVRDEVTWFEGIIAGMAVWIKDPPSILILGKQPNGVTDKSLWVAQSRCVKI